MSGCCALMRRYCCIMGVCFSRDCIAIGEYNRRMERLILTRLPRALMHLFGCAAFALVLVLAGCTPQSMLASALIPEGTASILLGHLQGMEEANLKHVAALEARKDWDGLAKFAEDNLSRDKNSADWWFVAGYAH